MIINIIIKFLKKILKPSKLANTVKLLEKFSSKKFSFIDPCKTVIKEWSDLEQT